ncbi:hypothetical protein HRI_001825500 [Hibiscus trionum]|uniref:Selenoprotein H n=1 Tax=Hibiscus trionum TaxID=183268 RepID=A0A9W7HQD0_HIBTR|nr:hypothetical protein HRI_001825500 [Hibiscus trionum]
MAPRATKRKAMEGDEEQPKPQVEATVKRVTRSTTKQPDGKSQPSKEKPKAKSKAKPSPKGQKESVEEDAAKAEASPEELTAADGGSHNKTVIVEHCKQCNSFKTRAFQVRDGLQKGAPGVNVLLNPGKPRRGCFEIREEGGETFISLLDMKRPFKPMKELDMEKVVSDIIEKIK